MRFYKKSHAFYCGVDRHARTMHVCILDSAGASTEDFLGPCESRQAERRKLFVYFNSEIRIPHSAFPQNSRTQPFVGGQVSYEVEKPEESERFRGAPS